MKKNISLLVLYVAFICFVFVNVYNHFDQPIETTCDVHAAQVDAKTLECD